jgi:hypothetical protein
MFFTQLFMRFSSGKLNSLEARLRPTEHLDRESRLGADHQGRVIDQIEGFISSSIYIPVN